MLADLRGRSTGSQRQHFPGGRAKPNRGAASAGDGQQAVVLQPLDRRRGRVQ